MSISDDIKRAHNAIKNKKVRDEIMEIASRDGVSFNTAMKTYLADKN